MKKITILLLLMCFLSEFIFAQTYPGTPVSNPVRTYTQNDTKGVWVIGNGAPIFSPTAKMSQLYFYYMNQTGYFWNGSAWVAWTNDFLRTASNGLTEDGTNVKLGGLLTEETTIDLDGNDLIIEGTGGFAIDVTSNIQLQTAGTIDLLADGKLQTFTLANMEVYAAQDIAIETDDVINIHAINGGSIIVDNNDFVLTATAGDIQLNSPGTTAGVVNGIAYKADIANGVAVTDYGVNTTTAGVPDDGKVWTYNSTTNEMELQTLPSAIPGLNTIGSNQLTSGLRDSIVLNNWNTLGNAGTVQATNFIGTSDNIGLSLRTNNSIRQTILSTGEVGIGTISPTKKFSVSENTAVTNSIADIATFDLNTSGTAATGFGVQNIYRVEDPGGSLLDAAGVAGMLDESATPDGGALLLRAGVNGALSTIMSVYGKGFVGINTAGTPTDYLQLVVSGGDALGGHTVDKYDSSSPNSPANLTLSRSYGSYSSPSTIVTGARLGSINFKGYEGTSKLTMASIYAEATGTIGTNRVPTNMVFSTATDASPSVLTERLRINSEGSVSLPSSGLNASLPMLTMTGTWYASGTSTTSKPHFLIEPTGVTSTGWSAVGTAIGANAATGFLGKLIDLQKTAVSMFSVNYRGDVKVGRGITFGQAGVASLMYPFTNANGTPDNSGTNIQIGINTTTQSATAGGFSVFGSSYAQTSGNQYFNLISSSFGAGAGSANYRPFAIEYTINNSGVQSGTATGIFLNATETALNSMTHNLMDLQVGGVSRFLVSRAGLGTFAGGINLSGGDLALGSGAKISWSSGAVMYGASGIITLYSSGAETDAPIIKLGGTGTSHPAFKRVLATIETRLANDSGYADLSAARLIANDVVRLKGYTVATLPAGTVGDTAYVTDALAPAYMTTVVGGGAVTTAVFYNGTNWVAH